jgi:protein arginine kinase
MGVPERSSFADIGTGLRASVMMHLPGMAHDSSMQDALKAVRQRGFRVKGYLTEGERSLGDMYQISNAVSTGSGEAEILERLQAVSLDLADAERKARQMALHKQRLELEDRVFRALGLLLYARTITAREAIELLARVRLGISLGVIQDQGLDKVTALLFMTQSAHTKKLLQAEGGELDRNLLDYTRARMIQKALGGN